MVLCRFLWQGQEQEGERGRAEEPEVMPKRSVFVLRLGRPRTRPRRDGMLICSSGETTVEFSKVKTTMTQGTFMASLLSLSLC